MPSSPELMLSLPIEQVNTILMYLGKQEFDKVADLIMNIRMQAQKQVQDWQEDQKMSPVPKSNGGYNVGARPD